MDGVVCTLPTCAADVEPAPYKALGWKYKAFAYDALKGPPALVTAFQNAIQDHPKYIVLQGVFPNSTFQAQISEARKKHIGVVQLASQSLASGSLGCLNCNAEQLESGKLQVDIAVADGGASAELAYFSDPAISPLVAEVQGAQAEMAKVSSPGRFHVVNVSSADPPTVTSAKVVTYVQQHPSTKYLLFAVPSLADGVTQALAQVGLASKVKIITDAPESTDLQEISTGTQFAAVAAEDATSVWRCADILARTSVGDTIPTDLVQPAGWHKIITKQNVASAHGVKPEPPNYQTVFTTAWKG